MHFYRCTDFADRDRLCRRRDLLRRPARIYREEIAELAKAGCRYIQLDEVAVAMLCDPAIRAQGRSAGEEPDAWSISTSRPSMTAVAGAPADMLIGMHMCRGNFRGHYLSEGGYKSVAERFFTSCKVNHFLLEYDTDARRRLRAAALCAPGQGRRARPRQQQDRGAGRNR